MPGFCRSRQVLADPLQPGLSALEDGSDVSAETSRRLACDASKVIMSHDSEGRILDVGRKTRTIHPALRRALKHRDGGCRFPGCGITFCEVHHIEHWADLGETSLENTVLMCRRHHRAVHEEGYRVERFENGEIRFFSPRGAEIPVVPERLVPAGDALVALVERLEEDGIAIDPWTGVPTWEGERVDYSAALEYFV